MALRKAFVNTSNVRIPPPTCSFVVNTYEIARGVQGVRDDDVVVCLTGRGGIYPARYLDVLPGQSYKDKMDMATHAVRGADDNKQLIEGPAKELLGIVGRSHPRFIESPVCGTHSCILIS